MGIDNEHPDDKLHVVLDALATLRAVIEDDEFDTRSHHAPWLGYDGGDGTNDPKTTKQGYCSVLASAERTVQAWLSDSNGPR